VIAKIQSVSDPTYHARHSARSLRRAERIARSIGADSSILDVGCNYGITSQHLLDAGKACRVTGVELHADTVADSLRRNPRFTLIEGDIVEIKLDRRFDICVYGAVHHHILNRYGLSVAVETLQKLASHCDRHLFFETGQISEGGRWEWQCAIRRYFRTDEEHFFYLLRSIEHLVEDFSIVGRFWIHGARRSFLRLDMKPALARKRTQVSTENLYHPNNPDGPYERSFGSRRQRLKRLTGATESDSPTLFWIETEESGKRRFVKQYRHHLASAQVEWDIAQSIDTDWAVRPFATTQLRSSLVFPFIEEVCKVRDSVRLPGIQRQSIASQLLVIKEDAKRIHPVLKGGFLLRAPADVSIWDVCDLNENNLLLEANGGDIRVRVVDFEHQGIHCGPRNRMTSANLLRLLGQNRLRATINWLLGATGVFLWLLRYQLKPVNVRIKDRQPSLISLFVAEVRSRTGALFGIILRRLGYT
jgi:SAM-dependent methyltransferase